MSDVKLILGDCLDVMKTLPDGSVDLIVTDPPYNVGKDYGDMTNDSLPEDEYLAWYERWAAEAYRILSNGYLYVSCSTPQIWTLRPIWERVGFSFQMLLIWHGPNYAGNSNTIRGQWRLLYEPIFMLLKGNRLSMLNEVRGVNSDAIIRVPRPQRNFAGFQRREHVAQKPVGLYRALIARTPGEVILDPFMGSGASGCAAAVCMRQYVGIEKNPDSFALAQRRIANAQTQILMMAQPLLI